MSKEMKAALYQLLLGYATTNGRIDFIKVSNYSNLPIPEVERLYNHLTGKSTRNIKKGVA